MSSVTTLLSALAEKNGISSVKNEPDFNITQKATSQHLHARTTMRNTTGTNDRLPPEMFVIYEVI